MKNSNLVSRKTGEQIGVKTVTRAVFDENGQPLSDLLTNQNEAINTNKSNINVLSSRMDTFTALEEGSTTGDAELQDIRVGYDGTTYSTAGNAVREQISDVNTKLVRYTNSKAYINGNTFRLLPVSGNGFAYAYFNRKSVTFDLPTYHPANFWFIIGECTNGCIIINGEGVLYYVSHDTSEIIHRGSLTLNSKIKIVSYTNRIMIYTNDDLSQLVYSSDTLESLKSTTDTFVRYATGLAILNTEIVRYVNIYTNIMYDYIYKQTKPYTISILGDSLTAQGYYTNALIEMGYTINNHGISGSTISNINTSNPFYSRINTVNENCDFVFVEGGTNDWGLGAPLGNKTDTGQGSFYGGLFIILTLLRRRFPTKTIFISEILQRNWTSTTAQASGMDSNANGNSIQEFNEAIHYMAERTGCFVIPSFSFGLFPENLDTYTSDGLHLNSLGGRKFALFLDNEFRKMPIYNL